MEKVTIAIPTYNQERFVLDAIQSALAQDYPNLEVVVVDDASSDNTEALCRSLIGLPRFRYTRNSRNLGRVENYRNAIREVATGDWYLNLDGDDYLTDPSYVSEAMRVAQSDLGIVLVWGNCLVAWDGKPVAPFMSRRFSGDPIIMRGEDLIMKYPPFLSTISPPHLASLVDRRVALDANYYRNESLCCDSESVYRVGFGYKVAIIDRVAGVWRQHGGNDSHTMADKIHASNVSRSNGIYQWACESGAFSWLRLRRLRRTLDAGDGIAWFARAALAGRLRYAPFALLRAMMMYPRSSLRILAWALQRASIFTARRIAMRVDPDGQATALKALIGRVPRPPAFTPEKQIEVGRVST